MVAANPIVYSTETPTPTQMRRLVFAEGKMRRKKKRNASFVSPWQMK